MTMKFRLSEMLEKASVSALFLALKASQSPRIMREKRAPLLSDEVVREPGGGSYAIFIKYYGRDFDAGQLALLQSLRAERVNILVVFNREPTGQELEVARRYAWRVVIRKNVGRDFGAYRSAVLNLISSGAEVERLLFLNDSVFYLPGRQLGEMVGRLVRSDRPVTGAFENHARTHHLGSFAFAVSGDVYRDARFQAFWRNYRPYDLRQHAIRRGEIALSQLYRKMNISADVVFSLDRLGGQLDTRSFADIVSLLQTLPLSTRPSPVSLLKPPAELLDMMVDQEFDGDNRVYQARVSPFSKLMTGDAHPAGPAVPALAKRLLIDRLLADAAQGSQIHLAFGLYRRLLSVPLVKRDLLHQGVYAEHDIPNLLDDVAEDFRHEMIRDMVSRQRPIHIGRWRTFLRRHGFNG
ncbi:MAG TPA: hypothetical protein PK286_07680 [Devosia sp.]|nr:hypothetical protein [Devosia sp.]